VRPEDHVVTDPIHAIDASRTTLALPSPLQVGPTRVTAREYAAVRIQTSSGLVGKAYCLTRDSPVVECVERLIAPIVTGADSVDIAQRWDDCFRSTIAVGRVGLFVRALGLVDIALWDIAAQRAGVPLWSLLGGRPDPVPAMLVAAYPLSDRTPEELAADVIAYSRAGYSLLKIARDPEPDRMRRLLAAALDRLEGGCRLVVDAAFGWRGVHEALEETSLWGEVPLAWLEDPLIPEDVVGCSQLRSLGGHPLGIGDDVTDPRVITSLVQAQALDVVRLDVVAIGGVTAARPIMTLAETEGLPVSFHVYPEVTVHLAAAMAGATVEHFDPEIPGGNPLDPAHLLCIGAGRIQDGWAKPPELPGLGFDLDWARFESDAAGQRSTSASTHADACSSGRSSA
jgi:L-alanine-DL-glutamate epimerase-like enolase superfamily enzyme